MQVLSIMAAYCLLLFMMSFHKFCDRIMLCKCMGRCMCCGHVHGQVQVHEPVHVPVKVLVYVYCRTHTGVYLHLGSLGVTSYNFFMFFFQY